MTDNHGYVLAPLPVAPINETDMVLFPEGLKALKKVAKEVGLDLRGAYVNLDGGFDSRANRKCIFQIPSDLVVKSQVTDIIGLILQLIRHLNNPHRACRYRKSRGELLSTSEVP